MSIGIVLGLAVIIGIIILLLGLICMEWYVYVILYTYEIETLMAKEQ